MPSRIQMAVSSKGALAGVRALTKPGRRIDEAYVLLLCPLLEGILDDSAPILGRSGLLTNLLPAQVVPFRQSGNVEDRQTARTNGSLHLSQCRGGVRPVAIQICLRIDT